MALQVHGAQGCRDGEVESAKGRRERRDRPPTIDDDDGEKQEGAEERRALREARKDKAVEKDAQQEGHARDDRRGGIQRRQQLDHDHVTRI